MRVLWLLPDLAYSSAARQALLLIPCLVAKGLEVEVAVLRSGGPLSESARGLGVTLHECSSPHDSPLRAIAGLERLLRSTTHDLVHAWRLPSWRSLVTLKLGRAHRPKLIISQPRRGGRWNPVDRLLLARADRLMPELGEPEAVPLAVGAAPASPRPLDLEMPSDRKLIMCIGNLTAEHGFRDAVWAFDVLKIIDPSLRFVIIGDGPERERIMRFSRQITPEPGRIFFLTDRIDASQYLENADIVWVPGRRPCGEQVALEAQAAGVPVVATDFPGLASIVRHEQTGFVTKSGEPVELAKATRPLLENGELRHRFGEAARQRAADHDSAGIADRWAAVYADVLASPVASSAAV